MKITNFLKLLIASAASNLGDGLALIAYPWLASSITRDPFLIALVPLFAKVPWLLFSLPAGVIIDRFDRRKLILISDFVRVALTCVVLFLVLSATGLVEPEVLASGAVPEPQGKWVLLGILYVAAFVLGMIEVLRDNAAQTILPSVVGKQGLESANSKLATIELLMNSLCGPPLAGFLIAISLAFAFAVNAGSLLLAALLVLLITGNYLPQAVAGSAEKAHWFADLKGGVKWLWQHTLLRDLAIALGLLNGAYMMSLATQVLFAQEILDLSPTGFGLLLTGAAFGGVLGGAMTPYLHKHFRSGTLMVVSVILFATETFVFGLTSNAYVAWGSLFIGSFAAVTWNVITVSLRQRIIPDQLLGRVNSVYRFFSWGMMPFGTLLGGALVSLVQLAAVREVALRSPYIVAGLTMVGVLLVSMFRLTNAKIDAARTEVEH